MKPFKIIRKSISTDGNLAKTYIFVYEDRLYIQQLFLQKKKQKGMKTIYKRFGKHLICNTMAFKMDTYLDFSKTLVTELRRQDVVKLTKPNKQ